MSPAFFIIFSRRFEIEQPLFPPQSTRISGQASVLSDHSVAGNKKCDRIFSVSRSDRSRQIFIAEFERKVEI